MNALRTTLLAAVYGMPLLCSGAFPSLYLKNVCDDQLHAPTNICNAGDGSGRLFICDQPGKIYVFQNGMLLPTPFMDLTSTGQNKVVTFTTAYSERGLLGMCFHPDFENDSSPWYRCFYVNYTAPATLSTPNPVGAGGTTNCVTVIAEYKVSANNPNVADPTSERVLLTYGQPQSNHNGGQIEFGPDGHLYIAAGDGGGADDNQLGHTQGLASRPAPPNQRVTGSLGNGQDRRTFLGKILRIDPTDPDGNGPLTYTIPPDNPFVGQNQDFTDDSLDGPMRGEIFAYGMRNPWRFCWDEGGFGGGALICADVGQLDVEEIDLVTLGGNYGWRIKEGTVSFDTPTAYGTLPTVTPPIAEYAHPTALAGHGTLPGTELMQRLGASITGGYVYRGSEIPDLQGKYVFADYAVAGITGGGGVLLGLEETAPSVFELHNGPLDVANPLPSAARIYCFGEDESGEIYFATKTTSGVLALDGGKPAGTIYKIQGGSVTTLTLNPVKDNTMYEGSTNSNGRGEHLYVGRTGAAGNDTRRRALLKFDLSSVPSGVTLTSASVYLTITKQIAQDFTFNLHRMNEDWGEGTSNAGEPGGLGVSPTTNDATWSHRFYPATFWPSPGAEGSYVSTPSAAKSVGNFLTEPVQVWTGATLLTDVQGWITNPASNFGWIIRGDDTEEATAYSATRFGSRNYNQSNAAYYRPKLEVTYNTAPAPSFFESWLTSNYPSNPPGTYIDLEGDDDLDGMGNLLEYAYGYSPTTVNVDNGLTTSISDDSINTFFHVTFRRDPRATDLIYELQFCEDVQAWSTEVISLSGDPAFATNIADVSEISIAGQSPMRQVLATFPVAGLDGKNFVRLKVSKSP